MKISTIPNMPDSFELILFGDDQEGNAAKATDKYLQCIEYICEKESRYGIHMGDACDAFWVDDKRYSEAECKQSPIEQKKAVIEQLSPLAKTGRLLSILEGNHERALTWKMQRLLGKDYDFSDDIASSLRAVSANPLYPISGTFTNIIDFSGHFKGYFVHGAKSISSVSPDPHRRLANMQYRLKLILEKLAGDCIVMCMGHRHIVLVTPPLPEVYLTSERGKFKQHYTTPGTGKVGAYIPPDARWYGCTGSFLKTFLEGATTYSERAQYSPTEIGYLICRVENKQVVDLREVKI